MDIRGEVVCSASLLNAQKPPRSVANFPPTDFGGKSATLFGRVLRKPAYGNTRLACLFTGSIHPVGVSHDPANTRLSSREISSITRVRQPRNVFPWAGYIPSSS